MLTSIHSKEYLERQEGKSPAEQAVESLMALAAFIRTGAGQHDPGTRFRLVRSTGEIGVIKHGDDVTVDPEALVAGGLEHLENLIGVIAAANGISISREGHEESGRLIMGGAGQVHEGVDTSLLAPGTPDLSPRAIPETGYSHLQSL